MSNRRMFSSQIVDSDAFLDMPSTTQNLYFHLGMRADDDGFIGNPKKVLKILGGNDDDLKLLLAKRFVLGFESGVIVIKHWLIHNLIRADMYKETLYKDEKKTLGLNDNGAYTEMRDGISEIKKIEAPKWLKIRRKELCTENVPKTAPRIGKDRIGKEDDLRKSSTLETVLETNKEQTSTNVSEVKLDPSVSEPKMEHNEYFESLGLYLKSVPNQSDCWEDKWFKGNNMQSEGAMRGYEKMWTEYSGKVSPTKPEVENQNTLVRRIQHKFADLCQKELGTKPVIDMKGYKMVQFALNSGGLSEKKIYDLFDEWFGLGKPDEETIQITRALSSNNINIYKTRNI